MVVLAASICTKSGKPVISRQFREMPRSRIDGLLTSFPKLIPANSQHTTIETAEVRYVYQPLEELYILLITNKASNILQDIDTLHLFARVISDLCRSADEREIARNAFELLGAFDEVISLGFREQVNLAQIRNVIEMESHEEKIQDIIARNKEAEAKEELKRRAKQLEMQRREMQKRASSGLNAPGGYLGSSGGYSAPSYTSVPRFEAPTPPRTSSPAPAKAPAFKGSGMKLGRKGRTAELVDVMGGELTVDETPLLASPPAPVEEPVAKRDELAGLPAVAHESVHVAIREHLKASLIRDGGVRSLELTGDLNLSISDPAYSKIRLNLTPAPHAPHELQFKQHPNVAKFGPSKDKVVALKDQNRDWPVGQKPLGVLKWRLASKDESLLPLTVNCWPSQLSSTSLQMNLEYELEHPTLTLRNLLITIPLPDGAYPTIADGYTGNWSLSSSGHALDWTAELVDAEENKSGSLEFTVDGTDVESFFPVQVSFASSDSMAGIKVGDVVTVAGGEEVTFSQDIVLVTDEYVIS
ncbi:hypothetical protein CALCODRAFT_495055 [Calocera cornea HHB12733]|uniref:Coatomer subunit delta n=1 Tax=Calocera cornea HHB12733 TaxID=1353952 RepID=A0A165GPV7_9BASI|nr:hypothetical protein CALCODRAFT_495055 [Calocera cornea HHB12733]